jgi:hypothetical protein
MGVFIHSYRNRHPNKRSIVVPAYWFAVFALPMERAAGFLDAFWNEHQFLARICTDGIQGLALF